MKTAREEGARAGVSPAVWLVGVLGAATVLLPVTAGAVAATLVSLAGAVILAAMVALGKGRALEPRAVIGLAALAALAAWLTLAASLAVEPRVSFFGLAAQHDGALLWITVAAIAWASAALAGPRDLRHAIASIAVLGGVLGFGTVLERLGILGEAGRFSPEASGFLENSLSLGQVLVLALGCAVAWFVTSRGIEGRIAASISGALCAAGLLLGQSRAAWVGLAFGIVAAFLLTKAGARARRVTSIVLVAAAVAWVALMPLVLEGRFGQGARGSIDAFGTSRATIWTSAYAVAGQDLVFGRGPDRFSCWVVWDTPTPDAIQSTGGYDPHDALLAWLTGGGIPALLLGIAAFGLLYDALMQATAKRGGLAMAVLLATLLAWAITLRFAWVAPLSATLAALLAGSLLGTTCRREDTAPAWRRGAGLGVALLLSASLAFVALPALTELRWALQDHSRTAPAETLEADFASWPDPEYARLAIEKRIAAGTDADLARARETAETATRQSAVHVDLALTSVRLQQLYGLRTGIDTDAEFEAAIAAGKLADPATGMWDYVGALAADARGDDEAFEEHAEAALTFPLPPVAEEWLRSRGGTVAP